MNRLVRIALTLFASATILIFLVLQRLQRAREASGANIDDDLSQFARSEIRMAYAGMGIVAILLIAGVALIVTAVVRSRKKSTPHG